MDRNDGAGAWGDGTLQKFGINVGSGWIDVDENGTRPAIGDGFGGGEERVRRGDDFVARLDAQGKQTEM
jgi:hypothetical protein